MFGFGQSSSSPFGSSFGAFGQSSNQMGFGFGQSNSGGFGGFGGFGAPSSSSTFGFFGQSSPAAGFGGFGMPQPSSAGFGGFGMPQSSAAAGFGGFGMPQSSAAAGFGGFGGFGMPQSSAGFGGFGGFQSSGAGFGFGQPTTSAGGFGMGFGQPAGGFGFGQPSAGGFGFGQSSSSTGFGGFGQPSSSSAGFGLGFGQPTASGFGFGQSSSGGFGLGFGQPTPGGFGGFGQPSSSGFGSFGQPTSSGFGGFGNSSGGFGFGQPAGFSQSSTSFGGFGGFGQPNTGGFGAFGASSGGFGFPSSSSGGFGLGFGSSSSSPFGFGSSSSPGFGGFGGFGMSSSSPFGTFGQPSSSGFGFGGFGPSTSAPFGAFGAMSSSAGFGGSLYGQPTIPPAMPVMAPLLPQSANFHQLSPQQQYQLIEMAYKGDARNPACSFRKMLYCVWQEGDVARCVEILKSQYTGISPSAWGQAMLANPDPKRLVPIPISSFSELHNRVEKQQETAELYKKTLGVLRTRVNAVEMTSCRPDGRILTKLATLQERHRELQHQLLCLMGRLQLRRQRGLMVNLEERELHTRLSLMQKELSQPNHYQGKLQELAPRVAARLQQPPLQHLPTVADARAMQDVVGFLQEQKCKLKVVADLIQKDQRDLALITEKCNEKLQQQAQGSYLRIPAAYSA